MTDDRLQITDENSLEEILRQVLDLSTEPGEELEDAADEALEALETFGAQAEGAHTYLEGGIMTQNRGLCLRLKNGAEFQITIVQSRQADRDPSGEALV